MTDEQEEIFAIRVLELARNGASLTSNPEDVQAATAGILIKALELATPELSPGLRASLFLEEE